LFAPKNLTIALMDEWVKTFENWEICDSFCMALFAKSLYALPQALKWTNSTETFEKRAGFTTIAAYCMADKKANNEVFLALLPIIEREATDERLYVKKAVNWALRNIGKRNKDLNMAAINCAKRLLLLQNKTSTWIANNALKELCKPNKRLSDYPRSVYRPK
jgi:3-methyladenine DNA glycosylase AlkD